MKVRRRTRPLSRVLVRVLGCLALVSGLLAGGAGAGSAEQGWADPVPALAATPGGADRGGALLDGRVTPLDSEVDAEENGDFTLSVTNTGALTADNVQVLLDDAKHGNGVGSSDGRCLSRMDASSPADLWCELGDLKPRQSVRVEVHAYMNQCVWLDPEGFTQRAPAFRWRVGYDDGGRALALDGPTPRWSCTS